MKEKLFFYCRFELPEAFTTRIHKKTCKNPQKNTKNTAAGTNILPQKGKVLFAFYTRMEYTYIQLYFNTGNQNRSISYTALNILTPTQPQYEVKSGFPLNVVVRQSPTILKLLPSKN